MCTDNLLLLTSFFIWTHQRHFSGMVFTLSSIFTSRKLLSTRWLSIEFECIVREDTRKKKPKWICSFDKMSRAIAKTMSTSMQNNAATGKRAYFPYLNRVLNELGVYVWCALSSCIKHIFNTKGIVHVAVFIRLTHCKCAFTVSVCVSIPNDTMKGCNFAYYAGECCTLATKTN